MKEFKCSNLGIFGELVLCAGGVSEILKVCKKFTGSQGHNEKQQLQGHQLCHHRVAPHNAVGWGWTRGGQTQTVQSPRLARKYVLRTTKSSL